MTAPVPQRHCPECGRWLSRAKFHNGLVCSTCYYAKRDYGRTPLPVDTDWSTVGARPVVRPAVCGHCQGRWILWDRGDCEWNCGHCGWRPSPPDPLEYVRIDEEHPRKAARR